MLIPDVFVINNIHFYCFIHLHNFNRFVWFRFLCEYDKINMYYSQVVFFILVISYISPIFVHIFPIFFLYFWKKIPIFSPIFSCIVSGKPVNEETFLHLYTECALIKSLWSNLKRFFGNDVFLPDLVPQAAFFGFLPELDVDNFLLLNHILLIFKIYVYNSRQSASVNFEALLKKIIKIKNIEKKIASLNNNKFRRYRLKWQVTDAKLQTEWFHSFFYFYYFYFLFLVSDLSSQWKKCNIWCFKSKEEGGGRVADGGRGMVVRDEKGKNYQIVALLLRVSLYF